MSLLTALLGVSGVSRGGGGNTNNGGRGGNDGGVEVASRGDGGVCM